MEFRKITFDNYDECRKLYAGKKNENNVAPNTNSLAIAYVAQDNNVCKPMPFAIYVDDVMVGFIMMSYIIKKGVYDIWRFMIDEKYQNRGYGKRALNKAIEFLKTKPKGPADTCVLSYAKDNEAAKRVYDSAGFIATGNIDDDCIEMELKI